MEKVKGGNYLLAVKGDMTDSQMSAEMVCAFPPDGVKYIVKNIQYCYFCCGFCAALLNPLVWWPIADLSC